MADNGFTFWANMKETIDTYKSEHMKYLLYDAITEYGLYGVWPEDDGSDESAFVRATVQSFVPSLDKSRGYDQKQAEQGAKGGRAQKVTDEQIEAGIALATRNENKIPNRNSVVAAIKELFGIEISVKTLSRRYSDEKKKTYAEAILQGQNRDIKNVSGDIEGHKDKIETKLNVSEGQNEDKTDVPENTTKCPFVF